MQPFKPKSILIMTALPLEHKAVMRFLERKDEIKTTNGSVYERCKFQGLDVFVGLSGPGNLNAGPEVERALATCHPDVAIFSGIAGGVKDVSLGDVVIGSKVYGYEAGVDGSDFRPRPEIGLPSYILVQTAHRLAQSGEWRLRTAHRDGRNPMAYIGAIAAGEKVVKSSAGSVAQIVRDYFSDTLAVEMESAAFMKATYQNRVDAIVVRGISDLLDGKAEADKSGSQEVAADHAAAFTAELLTSLSSLSGAMSISDSSVADPVSLWTRFLEVASRLYPAGPKDSDVWLNAGGDLSRLELSESGRTQWGRALRKLAQGGGGDINARKLLAAMMEDFRNNPDLQYLSDVVSGGRPH